MLYKNTYVVNIHVPQINKNLEINIGLQNYKVNLYFVT